MDNSRDDGLMDECLEHEYLSGRYYKYLMEYQERVDKSTKDNALKIACKNGQASYVDFLLKIGADINVDYGYPLYIACHNCHLDVLKVLIENGLDLDSTFHRIPPLRNACLNGQLELVKFLCEHGAYDRRDHLSLRNACINGHLEVVKYLVSQGADIHAFNDTIIKYTVSSG